jgi:hypothetical protein
MLAAPIDPRDSRWERDEPVFRVYFWSRLKAASPEAPSVSAAISTDEYEVTETDVAGVLEWATARAPDDGGFVLYLVVTDSAAGLGLHRLAGQLPT